MSNDNVNYVYGKIAYKMYKHAISDITTFDIDATHYHSEEERIKTEYVIHPIYMTQEEYRGRYQDDKNCLEPLLF